VIEYVDDDDDDDDDGVIDDDDDDDDDYQLNTAMTMIAEVLINKCGDKVR